MGTAIAVTFFGIRGLSKLSASALLSGSSIKPSTIFNTRTRSEVEYRRVLIKVTGSSKAVIDVIRTGVLIYDDIVQHEQCRGNATQ